MPLSLPTLSNPPCLALLARSPVDDSDGQKRPPDRTVAPQREHLRETWREARPRRRLGGHATQRQGHVERPGHAPRDDPAAPVGSSRAATAAAATATTTTTGTAAVAIQRGGRGPSGDGGVEAEAVDAADGHLAPVERGGVVAGLALTKLFSGCYEAGGRGEGGGAAGRGFNRQFIVIFGQ